ncbi:MAG: helix-turn-helix transcriptional regulator [Clostridia bacterium]|nr:helix-turn-helix transcriptional regulator [Clostridia bacterium]
MKLYNDFVSAVGYTPNEYIRRRRLSIALSLITASEKSMTEISHICGYSSQQSFCREIKAILGITASEYKKRQYAVFLSAI